MKKNICILLIALFTLTGLSAFSQKYKSASDTVKLNKEWVTVSNDIAELTAKLSIAQNNLPGYNTKAKEAVTDALKRAAKNLGMSMGLALYDKEQVNVDDGEEQEQPAAKSAKPTKNRTKNTRGYKN